MNTNAKVRLSVTIGLFILTIVTGLNVYTHFYNKVVTKKNDAIKVSDIEKLMSDLDCSYTKELNEEYLNSNHEVEHLESTSECSYKVMFHEITLDSKVEDIYHSYQKEMGVELTENLSMLTKQTYRSNTTYYHLTKIGQSILYISTDKSNEKALKKVLENYSFNKELSFNYVFREVSVPVILFFLTICSLTWFSYALMKGKESHEV